MKLFQIHRVSSSRPLVALLLAACSLLTGCKRNYNDAHKLPSTTDSHMTQMNQINPLTDMSTGHAYNSPFHPGRGSLPGSDSSQDTADYYTTEDGHKIQKTYYTVYADIYWKLNWIRLQLVEGRIPSELPQRLSKLRKELVEMSANIAHDGNYTVADEALSHLEKGAQHLVVIDTLRDAGATVFAAPWSSGSIAMQGYIDAGSFGFGGKSIANSPLASTRRSSDDDDSGDVRRTYTQVSVSAPLTPMQRRAISTALAYADQYHTPPEVLMKQEWNEAVTLINKLRDQLWLMNQPQNSDNGSIVNVQPDKSPSASFSEGGRFSTSYSKSGTDLPIGSAPAGDPFSVPSATSSRRR